MGDGITIELDDVDRGVLHLLQKDARNTTAEEMAEQVGVSASTVRNRIEKLKEGGVVRGYRPIIDYEQANLPLHVLFVCTVRSQQRKKMAQKALNVKGVIGVKEMITSVENLHVEAVGLDTSDLVRITNVLQEMELEIRSAELMKEEYVRPFDFSLGTRFESARSEE